MRRKKASAHLPDAASPLLIGGAILLALDVGRRIFRRSQLFEPEREPVISWNPEDYGIPRERTEELSFETRRRRAALRLVLPRANIRSPRRSTATATPATSRTPRTSCRICSTPASTSCSSTIADSDAAADRRRSSGIIDDGVTAARLHEKIRPKNLPSILYGYSLGGAIAAQVIRRHPFDGLILQSTFTNLPDIARVTFPRVPLHLVSGRLFDTLEVVRNLTVPAAHHPRHHRRSLSRRGWRSSFTIRAARARKS